MNDGVVQISLANDDYDGDDDHGMWDDEYDDDEYDDDDDYDEDDDEYYELEYNKDELESKKVWHPDIDTLSEIHNTFFSKQLLVSIIVVFTSRLL